MGSKRRGVLGVFFGRGVGWLSAGWACLWVVSLVAANAAAADDDERRLFFDDGQMKNQSVSVFVTDDVTASQVPRLYLQGIHTLTRERPGEDAAHAPKVVARNQTKTVTVDGVEQARKGTLLVFDLSKYPFPFLKPMMRVRPTLTWDANPTAGERAECPTENPHETCQSLTREESVNLGNALGAYVVTTLIVLAIVGFLMWLGYRSGKGALSFARGDDGRWSLSRVQMALWTLAVAWVFLSFGLVKRTVPEIPWQAVALMGLSLVTAGVVGYRTDKVAQGAPASTAAPSQGLIDLVVDGKTGQLSLPRAQMLVWTVITLLLFGLKSALEGEVWAVPEALVVLMGMSQVSYLAPKWQGGPISKSSEEVGK